MRGLLCLAVIMVRVGLARASFEPVWTKTELNFFSDIESQFTNPERPLFVPCLSSHFPMTSS
jgi:hypothetical protein